MIEIRDSATRQKYLDSKKFVEEYEAEYSRVLSVKNYNNWRLYELRSEVENIRKLRSFAAEERVKTRLKLIKEYLKIKYGKSFCSN